jgi:hypothetical protein
MMRVLVACEFSGIVKDAFREQGHDAWSCDLLPTESQDKHHITGDVREVLDNDWDLMIAHPPCTHTAVSGARWFKDKQREQKQAVAFFFSLYMASWIRKRCIEHPVSIMSTRLRPPDQYIQPWQFGHGETKKIGLWLCNLPKLQPTDIVSGRIPRIHYESPGPDRWKRRSRFYTGIARAMAVQWGVE